MCEFFFFSKFVVCFSSCVRPFVFCLFWSFFIFGHISGAFGTSVYRPVDAWCVGGGEVAVSSAQYPDLNPEV